MSGAGARQIWPAAIIHVNEDGWVLINRGRRHGILSGLRLLVVGTGVRELRDLSATEEDASPVLRIRRTYEELDIVYVEEVCAVAVATRAPTARRPRCYCGPEGELLVWVPLPDAWTYPQPGSEQDVSDDEDDAEDTPDDTYQDEAEPATGDEADDDAPDVPPAAGEQDDQRWEQALPLNGVAVGDLVVPAIPAAGTTSALSGDTASIPSQTAPALANTSTDSNPFELGREYGWMKSE